MSETMRKWFLPGLLATGVGVAAGWMIRERLMSDRERIERALRRLVEAVEEGSAGGFRKYISSDYTDQWGNRPGDLRQAVGYLSLKFEKIVVDISLAEAEIKFDPDGQRAETVFRAEVRVRRHGESRGRDLVAENLGGNRLRLVFEKEGRSWLVTRAELAREDEPPGE